MEAVSKALEDIEVEVALGDGFLATVFQPQRLAGYSIADDDSGPIVTDDDALPAYCPPLDDDALPAAYCPPLEFFPPLKDDKPRPHVCRICMRPFARLEHLKRHERSHTKEKPFGCPVCERCFARRDLLLRHKQKLHQTPALATRPRHRRQSSNNAVIGTGRVRKNSAVSHTSFAPASTMRPRANTISHIDAAAMQILAAAASASDTRTMSHGHARQMSLAGDGYSGMAAAMSHRGTNHPLPRLDTQGISTRDYSFGLRTAPPLSLHPSFSLDDFFFCPGSTVNPNALHYHDSTPPISSESNCPSYSQSVHDLASQAVDDAFDWLTGFDTEMSVTKDKIIGQISNLKYESGIECATSAIGTNSQSGIRDVMLDGSNHPAPPGPTSMWHPSTLCSGQMLSTYGLDLASPVSSSTGPDPIRAPSISPQSHQLQDSYFCTPPSSLNSMSSSVLSAHAMNHSLSFDAGPGTLHSTSHGTQDLLELSRDETTCDLIHAPIPQGCYSIAALKSTNLIFPPSHSRRASAELEHVAAGPVPLKV